MPEITGRLRTPRLATAPSSPAVGEIYYDTGANKLYWWNGTTWVDSTGGGGGGGTIVAAAARSTATGATVSSGGAWASVPLPTSLVIEPSDAFTFSGNNVAVKDAGWYQVSASMLAPTGTSLVYVALSTSATAADGDIANSGTNTQFARINASGAVKLAAGAKVYLYGYSSAVINFACLNFSITRVGGTKGDTGPMGGSIPQTYALSGYAADRVINAGATSLNEVVSVLCTLIADMQAAGLIQP